MVSHGELGIFENYTNELKIRILHNFRNWDLVNLAETNRAWRQFIGAWIHADAFTDRWLSTETAGNGGDCYSALCELIYQTHDTYEERVQLIEHFMTVAIRRARSYERAGRMLAAHLSHEAHDERDEMWPMVSHIFQKAWHLDKTYFEWAVPRVIDAMAEHERNVATDPSLSPPSMLLAEAFLLRVRLNKLFLAPMEEDIIPLVYWQILNQAFKMFGEDLTKTSNLVKILMAPGNREVVSAEFQTGLFNPSADSGAAAMFFESTLATSRYFEDVTFVTHIFLQFIGSWDARARGHILFEEPALIRLLLHNQNFWVRELFHVAGALFFVIMELEENDEEEDYITEEKYCAFEKALEWATEQNMPHLFGNVYLNSLVRLVRFLVVNYHRAMQFNRAEPVPLENRYLSAFRDILLRRQ